MKPSFALDLRFSVLSLLHRTARGWTKVGEAALNTPDLAEALAFMRSTALGLSPRGITTKLILPNSQILYTKVMAPVAEPWTRTRRIGAALDGLTPYRLDELAYDWCETASGLQVAVVAKETLEEAETFARDHRLNPVSFVAVPEEGTYLGEPFFGASKLSKSLLAKEETVERDSEAVRVVGRSAPKAKPIPSEDPAAEVLKPEPPEASPVVADTPQPPALIAKDEVPVTADQPAVVEATRPDPAAPEETNPTSAAFQDANPAETAAVEAPVMGQEPLDVPDALPASPSISAPVEAVPQELVPQEAVNPAADTAQPAPNTDVPEAPMLVDVAAEDDDVPLEAVSKPQTPAKKSASALSAAAPAKPKAPRDARLRALGPAATGRPPLARPASAKPLPKTGLIPRPTAARPWQTTPFTSTKDKLGSGADLAAPRTAFDRMMAANGRETPKQRRHLILILAAVLVALLALIAIWSSLSLGTNGADNGPATPAAVTAQSSTSPPAASSLPSAQGKAVANVQSVEPATATVPNTTSADAAKTNELGAGEDTTTVPKVNGKDEIFLAGADTPPVSQDPIALPALVGGADSPPILPAAPPPYGANLTSDEPPARLTPTPEGVITPEGVLIIAGQPPKVPPARPADLVPSVAPQTATAEAVLAQDPSFVGKRPLARPVDLVPVASIPSDPNVPALDSRFASLRPQARPTDLTPPAPAPDALVAEGVVLASSPLPPARPADVTTGINDAVAVALNQDTVADQPAADQPAAEPEADVEAPAPTLPTNASVAKQATERNALNANRVALLGIFGTPTSRYAMVRLASGRVKKVQVGDTVEGGRIAGITAEAVKYQKGSRIVTLSLP